MEARVAILESRMSTVETTLQSLPAAIEARHKENRQSIHNLKGDVGAVLDKLHVNHAETIELITDKDKEATEALHKIDKKLAGYIGLAVGAMGAIDFAIRMMGK